MSILDAMYTGVSGLDAESGALGVIGNNVSNTNTVGFKESRAIFETVMGSAAGTSADVGGGVRMSSTQQIFAQGSLQNTGNATDVALQGDGFFVVHGSVGGSTGNFYTRAGQTSLNSTGTLVNPDGLALQGYSVLPSGQMSTQLGNITLSSSALQPKATASVKIAGDLNPKATPPAITPFDPQNPAATSNGSTQITTYDSLGNAHQVSVYLVNTGPNQWDYHELAPTNDISPPATGNTEIGNGSLTFDNNGALSSLTVASPGTVTFNGAAQQTVSLNLGTPTGAGGTGTDGITQVAGSTSGDFTVAAQSQDGYSSGSLSGVQIGQDGTVSGVYTNGQTLAVGQLAIAKFQSNDGLSSMGQNLWSATTKSGDPAVAAAGSGGRGSIQSGALEQSNVDIASQFVDLIAHQQGFEANSKTVTTVNQMLSSLQQMIQ